MIEPILEYSSFVSFHNLVCSPSHNGAYPLLREHQAFHRLHSPFDRVVDPRELHIEAYPHSLGSSDLSEASLYLDLVVDPHELSYWGISPPFESACIVILVSSDFGPLDQIIVHFSFSRLHLYRSVICLSVLVFWDRTYIDRSFSMSVCVFGTTPISIGHHLVSLGFCFRDRTYIDQSFSVSVCVFGTAPISIGHFPCQFVFSRLHLYRSVIILSVWVFVFETAPISISHCLISQSLGPHLYRLVISLSCQFSFWDRTYIDRSSSYQFEFKSGPHLYRSVISLSC